MTKQISLHCFATAGLMLVFALAAKAAEQPGRACPTKDGAVTQCNGISVGAPKVYDNRTLTLMINSLSQALQAQQQGYMDQKSVAAALQNLQGSSSTESDTSLSVNGPPSLATTVQKVLNTGVVSSTGAPLPNTTTTTATQSRAAVTPTAPTLDTVPALTGFNPNYGTNASDLMNDQVNLTYQLFNLRMVLDRALSDRLYKDPNDPKVGDNSTRLQAVLGFNVTIDPPRTAKDAVAVVEITLKSTNRQALSLVTLMPQEKTYNSAALSSKSNAFGGAAAAGAFQVGGAARKRSQIFYLYRDNDTLSYERMTSDRTTIVFGWMFRPVLGRKSVSPGLRQLFAVAALPNVDCKSGLNCPVAIVKSTVRTYWKQYDRATLTSFEHRDANRASEFWYGLSMGLAKPQIFDDLRYVNETDYGDVEVYPSSYYQKQLQPQVDAVTWRPTGSKNIILSARGNNFFTGTRIALGDKTYDESSGLTLKSDQSFDLLTTVDALVSGPGTVMGRYDNGVPLINLKIPQKLMRGIQVQSAILHQAIAGTRQIDIELVGKPCDQELAEILDECKQDQDLVRSKIAELQQVGVDYKNKAKQETELKNALKEEQQGKTAAAKAAAKQRVEAAESALAATDAEKADSASLVARVEAQLAALENEASNAESDIRGNRAAIHDLTIGDLPTDCVSGAYGDQPSDCGSGAASSGTPANEAAPAKVIGAVSSETPVISVNGTPLAPPYKITDYLSPEGPQMVQIVAYGSDDLLSAGGVIRVSWPFYPRDRWTAELPFRNPELGFEVTRMSAEGILIRRIDGSSFANAPENTDQSSCWQLYAGDTATPLTASCPKPPPTPVKKTVKGAHPAASGKAGGAKPAEAKPAAGKDDGGAGESTPPAPLKPPSDYVVTAQIEALPEKALLVAPNGAIYSLTIPAAPKGGKSEDKDSKPDPAALNQYDAPWLQISADDCLPIPGADDVDLSQVKVVEANGKRLHFVAVSGKPAKGKGGGKAGAAEVSIEVEITRDLTSKPGAVDIGLRDAQGNLLGTRQLEIAAVDSSSKGGGK
jgi:hypothetical protein